jgi:SAM-dependent methyltransferase
MLHHVPSPELQDSVLKEARRVLRPGGVFVGVDSRDRPEFRALHDGDVCVPVDPNGLAGRLREAGFKDIRVDVRGIRFRFRAGT